MAAIASAIWNFLLNLFVTLLNLAAAVGIGLLIVVFVMAAIYQMYMEAKKNV